MGNSFKGVYSLYRQKLHLFTPGADSHLQEGIVLDNLADSKLDELLGLQAETLREDVELMEGAANPFEHAEYLKASQTPVFFGGAKNGVCSLFSLYFSSKKIEI